MSGFCKQIFIFSAVKQIATSGVVGGPKKLQQNYTDLLDYRDLNKPLQAFLNPLIRVIPLPFVFRPSSA